VTAASCFIIFAILFEQPEFIKTTSFQTPFTVDLSRGFAIIIKIKYGDII